MVGYMMVSGLKKKKSHCLEHLAVRVLLNPMPKSSICRFMGKRLLNVKTD